MPFPDLLDPKRAPLNNDEAASLYRDALLEVCERVIPVLHQAMVGVADPQLRAQALQCNKAMEQALHQGKVLPRHVSQTVNAALIQARYVMELSTVLAKAKYHQDRAAQDLKGLLGAYFATDASKDLATDLAKLLGAMTAQAEKALAIPPQPAKAAEVSQAAQGEPKLAPAEPVKTKKTAKAASAPAENRPAASQSPEPQTLSLDLEVLDPADAKLLTHYIEEGAPQGRFYVGVRGTSKAAGIVLSPTQVTDGQVLSGIFNEMYKLPEVTKLVVVTRAEERVLNTQLLAKARAIKAMAEKNPQLKVTPLNWYIYPNDETARTIEYAPVD